MRWTVQVDDTVGGFIVTDYPYPLSEHNHRPDGDPYADPSKRSYIIAECVSQGDAELIAKLLNEHEAWAVPPAAACALAPPPEIPRLGEVGPAIQ